MNNIKIPASLTSDMHVVIIGAGQAGGWAARTLRQENFAGRITLIGDEVWPPHERPPLSKGVLLGSAEPASTYLFPDADWATLNISWRPGRTARQLDRKKRTLVLDDGDILAWDRLIICTGGRPRQFAPQGLGQNCETLRTLDDALRLRERLNSARRVLVVGGGWIGLEVAAAARERGLDVILVEAAERLCARSLPGNISEWLLDLHRSRGVRVMLETVVQLAVRQADGSIVASLGRTGVKDVSVNATVDLIVAGIGMIANDELASEAGLECASGIIVDHACRTNDPGIFAAGDVASGPNSWIGRSGRLESWQNAQEQGIAAALSVMGRVVSHDPIPWFWSDQYGVNIQIQGDISGADHVVTRSEPDRQHDDVRRIHFYLRDGRLRGVVGLNAAKDVRISKKLIASGASLDVTELADASLPLNRVR